MLKIILKYKKYILAFVILNFLFASCFIILGPYRGIIVDKETNKPIVGAIVFLDVDTRTPNPGGYSSQYAGHIEAFTDDNGEFNLFKLVLTFQPLSIWGEIDLIILKPGYKKERYTRPASFPFIGNDVPSVWKRQTIKLKKISTKEDIKKNLRFSCTPATSCDKSDNVKIYYAIENLKLHRKRFRSKEQQQQMLLKAFELTRDREKKYSKYQKMLWKEYAKQLIAISTNSRLNNPVRPIRVRPKQSHFYGKGIPERGFSY